MKIAVIGDPHGNLEKIKKIPLKGSDLILVTGDLGKAELARQMAFENIRRKKEGLEEKEFSSTQKKKAFMESYHSSMKIIRYLNKFAPVFTIFGNVETSNYYTRKQSKEIGLSLPFLYNDLNNISNVSVINNKFRNFKGIKIGGLEYFTDTSWVKEFKPSEYHKKMKSAKRETGKAKRVLKRFRNRIDILICHQPPYGYLDKVGGAAPKHWQGKHAGSKTILDYIKRYQPKYVFCGHIHEGEGKAKIGNTEVYNLGVGGYNIIEF